MVLFDIRADDNHTGYIAAVNRGLDSEPNNPYLSRFGRVCSPDWWACFDRGELPVEVLSGEVTLVGLRPEPLFDEPEDVVEFDCGGRVIAYDRVGHWASYPIRVGDRVSITRTVAELDARTGLILSFIDLRGEWFSESGAPADSGIGLRGEVGCVLTHQPQGPHTNVRQDAPYEMPESAGAPSESVERDSA